MFELGHGASIEHGTSRAGRWLRTYRLRAALWIAVIEAIIVAFEKSVSRWTVIVVAVPLILLYLYVGRTSRSDTFRQLSWIGAASQALAVVAVLLAFFVGLFVLALAAVFALVALALLFSDRR